MEHEQRPPALTITADGIDISTQPERWPEWVREYQGLGRYELVGQGAGVSIAARRADEL